MSITNITDKEIALQAENDLLKGYRDRALELATAYNNARENIEQINAHREHILAVNEKLTAQVDAMGKGEPVVPAAWTNLLAYVLQDDMHNRLTPRVIDIAYTAFTLAKQPNTEDGGASDWFNDTKPNITKLIAKLHKDLAEELVAAPKALAPLTDDQCRAKFEAWYSSAPDAEPEPERTYELTDESMSELTKDCIWLGWRAAHGIGGTP